MIPFKEDWEKPKELNLIVIPEYAVYIIRILQICISIGIIIIALKFCKKDGSAVFHLLASLLCPPVYLVYKLIGDGCENLSKIRLGIILAVYIIVTVISLLIVNDNKNKNFKNELSEVIKKSEIKEETVQQNLEVNKYKKRLEEKQEGIIYGTIEE